LRHFSQKIKYFGAIFFGGDIPAKFRLKQPQKTLSQNKKIPTGQQKYLEYRRISRRGRTVPHIQ